MYKNLFGIAILIMAIIFSCTTPESKFESKDGLSSLSAPALASRIKTLSSDEFMGRMPFTEGEKITLNYIVNEFKALGLEPGNRDSYLQEVPMVEIITKAAPSMDVTGNKTKSSLEGLTDYVIWSQQTDEKVELKNTELVFAGFGIVAPEYNWNDYEGLDVKDKIVVVMVNDPGFGLGDTTFFKGNTMTYYGRWTYKYEEAARQGAKGCLVIHEDVPAGYGFWVVQNNWNTAKLYLDPRGKTEYVCPVVGWVTQAAARSLFDMAEMDYTSHHVAAHKNGFVGSPMNLKISTSMDVSVRYDKSYNPIAKITGAKQPDEYIIYTAHWDHLGIGKVDEKGDSIYNGAFDNASGTAGLLEIAKAFKSMENKPNRTILFLSVTAEEQGLLGSAYYAQNPIYALDQTVANINMDGINPYGKMKDIVSRGTGQSDLEDYLKREAEAVGRYVSPEPNPVAGYYFRSDHFNFAKVGVPALYTATGTDHAEKGNEFGKQLQDEYVVKYYHKPSDEFDPARWNLDGAVEDLSLLFQVGKRLSFEVTWPQWKATSEFKPIRDAYMN
ncbi:MAG: M20/M25/M40 family metallo-hydrolase [Flammeovirgaceae bacterium]|nr:M20/M25/M40 family metallo-hydrolase [Flammeovirgaceae bacterium]